MNGIHEVYCHDCGRYLCGAPMNTASYCPDCKRWTKLKPGEAKTDKREAVR